MVILANIDIFQLDYLSNSFFNKLAYYPDLSLIRINNLYAKNKNKIFY